MLLTMKDWLRFPNARIHYETKNTSFLKLANSYKVNFEVKNHAFLCALIHPELANVNPHSTELDQRTMALVYRECQLNPFYLIRECIRIPPKGTSEPVMFEANRGNIAMIWSFLMHMTYYSIQPRQTGKSVGLFAIFAAVLAVWSKNTNINFCTKDDVLRRESVKGIKELISYLPPYLIPRSKRDPDNQEEIKFTNPKINNALLTHLPQKDKKQANNVCRGTAAPIFGSDEGPFSSNSHISIPAAIAAGNRARENASAAGQLFGNIFTTTAGKLDEKEGEYMYSRISSAAMWNEKFLDCSSVEHLIKMVDTNRRKLDDGKDPGPGINGTFNHRQLGVPDIVHFKNIQQAAGDLDATNRDFFNTWSSGGTYNPLSNDILAQITLSEMEPTYTEVAGGDIIIKWYVNKDTIDNWPSNRKVVLGVDTSNAVGSDSCTGTFVDSITMAVIGTFNFNHGSLISFIFDFLAELLIKKEFIIINPENKINGQTVIDGLYTALISKGIDPFRRIFNAVVQNSGDERFKDFYKELAKPLHARRRDLFDKTKKYFGFVTAGSGEQSRSRLYGDVLNISTKRSAGVVRDRVLAREIKAITVKNGRLDHPEGAHDDQLISWLLSNWLVYYGKNLSFYGIDTSKMRLQKDSKPISKEDAYEIYKERLVRNKIDDLKEELKVTEDDVLYSRTKSRLLKLIQLLQKDDMTTSINSFIEDLENERKTGANKTLTELLAPKRAPYGGYMMFR